MASVVDQQPKGMAMQPIQTNLPPGLQYLQSLDSVEIHQVLHLVEVLVGYEKKNQYRICNMQDQEFLHVQEESECCERQWCGNIRNLTFHITSMEGAEMIRLLRPLNCQGCCCPCCLQVMEVQSPPGVTIAYVREVWSCFIPRYEVTDPNGALLFKIEGPCCYCKCGCDVQFKVTRQDGSQAGMIAKHWSGCREIMGQVNDFNVSFEGNEPLMNKIILLGSTFLVDMMYFEVKNQ